MSSIHKTRNRRHDKTEGASNLWQMRRLIVLKTAVICSQIPKSLWGLIIIFILSPEKTHLPEGKTSHLWSPDISGFPAGLRRGKTAVEGALYRRKWWCFSLSKWKVFLFSTSESSESKPAPHILVWGCTVSVPIVSLFQSYDIRWSNIFWHVLVLRWHLSWDINTTMSLHEPAQFVCAVLLVFQRLRKRMSSRCHWVWQWLHFWKTRLPV